MIDALDVALARLLGDTSAPQDVRDCDVSFEPPAHSYSPTQPTVNLFLADIHQNLDLRDLVPVREPAPEGYVETLPPIRVDCRYLVTVWAPTATSPAQRVADEHRLLGSVVTWLARFAVLPTSALGPRLSDQPSSIRLSIGLPHPGRELSDLWNALDISPRAGIWLSTTLALASGPGVIVGEPVTDVDVAIDAGGGPGEHLHIVGGRVRGAVSPLATAQVSVASLGRGTSTDADGVFRLGTVPEGTYELTVSAPDHLSATRTVHVPPAAGDDYDVQLVPDH